VRRYFNVNRTGLLSELVSSSFLPAGRDDRKYAGLKKAIPSLCSAKTHVSRSTFLDADDWFAPNGVKILFDMLERDQVNYAVGKTIEMQVNGQN
jgi:hypothetical protein